MPNDEAPGYDFLTLTKSQWRHLRRVERDHGIPWSVQIRNLVKADMDGKGIPSSGKMPSVTITEKRISEAVGRIEAIFNKLQKFKFAPANAQAGNFSAVFDEDESVKPSELEGVIIDPNLLSDGSTTGEIRQTFVQELRAKLGLPPLGEKRKAAIQFGSHVKIVDAPPPPVTK